MIKLTEKLAYFDFPSKVTVYMKGSACVLVDAGLEARTGRKVWKELNASGLVPEALLLTHAHADHFGGAGEIKKAFPGMKVMASWPDKPVFEQPVYEPYYLYGAAPLREGENKFLKGEPVIIDEILTPGEPVVLLGESWSVVDLAGHTPGQIGFVTPGQWFLTADAFFPEEVVAKYRLLYHFDLDGALRTLKRLEELAATGAFAMYLPGHGKPCAELRSVLIANLQAVEETVERMQTLIAEKPRTREELVACLMEEYAIQQSVSQYFLTLSSVSACLSYLERYGTVAACVEKGRLLFAAV